jgi:hypothetical protein
MAEHMIGRCLKCGITYDMDFEESIDDDHGMCYSEEWTVDLVDCDGKCGAASHDPDFVPRFVSKPLPDLSALPRKPL